MKGISFPPGQRNLPKRIATRTIRATHPLSTKAGTAAPDPEGDLAVETEIANAVGRVDPERRVDLAQDFDLLGPHDPIDLPAAGLRADPDRFEGVAVANVPSADLSQRRFRSWCYPLSRTNRESNRCPGRFESPADRMPCLESLK